MLGIDDLALKLGQAVTKAALKSAQEAYSNERNSKLTLAQLAESNKFRPMDLLSADRKTDDLADKIARRLQPMLENEYRDVVPSDRLLVFNAVAEMLASVSIRDADLFEADLDADRLAESLRPPNDELVGDLLLTPNQISLYERALQECCLCLLQVILLLKPFMPRAITEVLIRQSRLEETLEQALSRIPLALYDKSDDEFTRLYRENVVEHFDRLNIFGLGIASSFDLKLSIGYLSLTVESTGGEVHGEHEHNVPVAEALARGKRFVVRGEAGSGKSTLLQWIAVTSAKRAFPKDLKHWNSRVPFLLRLRDYSNRELPGVDEFIDGPAKMLKGAAPPGWINSRLNSGNCLLLVDGIDELTEAKRSDVRSWIRQIVRVHPNIVSVVTSRPAAIGEKWLDAENFAELRIEPLTLGESQTFVRRWHDAAEKSPGLARDPKTLPSFEVQLVRELEARPHLRSLASSPLLCGMICFLHLDRDGQLPSSRKELYEAALDMLLERREQARGTETWIDDILNKDMKLAIVRELASWLTLNNASQMTRYKAIEKVKDTLGRLPRVRCSAEQIVDYLVERSGLVRTPTVDTIDFVHRTFQEFLTAQQLAEEDNIGLAVRLAHEDMWLETIRMLAAQANMRQREALIAGIMDRVGRWSQDAGRFIVLAAVCCEVAVSLPPQLRERSKKALKRVMPPRTMRDASQVAMAGEAVLQLLPNRIFRHEPEVAQACVRTAALVGGSQALMLLNDYSRDTRATTQSELLASWDYFDTYEYARTVLSRCSLTKIRVKNSREVPQLRQLRQLAEVEIDLGRMIRDGDTRILDHLKELAHVPGLQKVIIRAAGLRGFEFLRRVTSTAATLHLWHAEEFDDDGVLADWLSLQHLVVSDSKVVGLSSFRRTIDRLVSLSIVSPLFIFDCSPLMVHDSNLRSLTIRKATVGSVPELSRLQTLTTLRFEGCQELSFPKAGNGFASLSWLNVTDCPAPQNLEPFIRSCLTLREIRVDDEAMAERLKNDRPDLVVRLSNQTLPSPGTF